MKIGNGLLAGFLCCVFTPSIAGVSFDKNQIEIVVAPGCSHVPVSFLYTPSAPAYDEGQISVSSDSVWATPSVNSDLDQIEIAFDMQNLISSYTATIEVNDGEAVTELFINAEVAPLDIYRLEDDPVRAVTYGILRNGVDNGAVIAFDPYDESFQSCITVGKGPTDFVINDDASELLVINSVSQSIDVIDLGSFTMKESLSLPAYTDWGVGSTTANIDLGPDGIIYYTDGAWAPMLHVLRRAQQDVIQSTLFFESYGFMDFAVTSDKNHMVAMPQYGWSAGAHTSKVGHLDINPDGTVSLVKSTALASFNREPFEAPALIRDDDQIGVMKTISLNPADTDSLDRAFPSAIWSMTPNGHVVATGEKLYDYQTGLELFAIPGGSNSGSGYTFTKAQAFTSDYTRFVYFNHSDRTLNVVNIQEEIGLEEMGVVFSPANGAVVNSPQALSWPPTSGVDEYDVYLGTDYSSVASADTSSADYLGRITGTSFTLSELLENGGVYYWRVDSVVDSGVLQSTVFTFTVSEIGIDRTEIDVTTVANDPDYQVDISLISETEGVSWSVVASEPWITFSENSGVTPDTLIVHLDASLLTAGFHSGFITLNSDSGAVEIPVEIEIVPLEITHIRSDRNSNKVYAISEVSDSPAAKAYLLEIDSSLETVLRTLEVGSAVTDLAIHYADDLLYVTNWKSGSLLVVDKNDFTLAKSIPFQPAGATGYSSGDVYRVAAGVSKRIVVEEEDQWIDISLINTDTENSLATEGVREGGGEFSPTGQYYYHGENNSSGAEIIKFDTSGDVFTQIAAVRPTEISSYYGSRTVLVSEDGSRVFWAGAVLDKDLNPEWGVGEIVHSASDDGRFAFASEAIYDINLRRQTLAMPVSTNVSGYNSTSKKLMVQVDDEIKFFSLAAPVSLPAPVLSIVGTAPTSANLVWTDESLEMEFVIQRRLQGESSWVDVKSAQANVTAWTAGGLQGGESYEFRVRAKTPDYSSPWSNVVVVTSQEQPNQAPIANDDFIWLSDLSGIRFSVIGNDYDVDGMVDAASVSIVTEPQFGEVIVHSDGDVTYVPGEDFATSDSFIYVISDDDSGVSSPAEVTIAFNSPPVLSIVDVTLDSIVMTWTDESEDAGYYMQIRVMGDLNWYDLGYIPGDENGVTISGLAENQRYEFRIRSIDAPSHDHWSNTVSATTKSSKKPEEKVVIVEKEAGAFLDMNSLLVLMASLFYLRKRRREA